MGVKTRASSPGGSYIFSGTLAAIPAAGVVNRYYWATNVQMLYRDNGVGWDAVGHGNLAGVAFAQHHGHYARMLWDILSNGDAQGTLTLGTTYAYLVPLQIEFTVTLDKIGVVVHTAAGNLSLVIYRDNGDTPSGATKIVETGYVGGFTSTKQEFTIADTQLTPGLYWLGVAADDATCIIRTTAENHKYRGVGFGVGATLDGCRINRPAAAWPDPCEVPTVGNLCCAMYVRVKSIP